MISASKAPAARPASRWAALVHSVRREWLVHQITGARISIVTTRRLIENDVEVAKRYPDMAGKITPDIDARHLDLEFLTRRLSQLQVQLIKLESDL